MLAGESGVTITLPANNSGIDLSTYTCTMVVTDPSNTTKRYAASSTTPSATYVTTGTEFPVAGQYVVELHAKSGSNLYKSRVTITVGDAYP